MRREMIIIAVLLVVVVGLILGTKFYTATLENSDAKKFVVEDLRTKYPEADKIEIISYEPKTNDKGVQFYAIKASVSEGLFTPCPKRTQFYYNYPVQNFVPAPPEYIVRECKVCTSNSTPCVIAFPEEAIVASHTLNGSELVQNYITTAPAAVPHVSKPQQGWLVVWTSQLNYSYEVLVGEQGTILNVVKK